MDSAREARHAAHALAALTLAALALLGTTGCQRRQRYDPIPADSTAVAGFDSLAIALRDATASWTDGGGETAAEATAEALAQDLARRPGEPLTERTRVLVDSLGLGAEVAGDGRVVAVNLFARADPGAGTWPYVLWRDGEQVAHHAVSGSGLQLVEAASRGRGERWDALALLYSRRAGSGRQPLVLVYGRPRPGSWAPLQSLGADSLGGVGEARLEARGDSTAVLTSRTWTASPRFEECPTCPHVYVEHTFAWGREGFRRVESRDLPSAYATFVRFIDALNTGDFERAALLSGGAEVLDAAHAYGFAESRGRWRVAPGTEGNASRIVFFRGAREAYEVLFTPLGESWLVSRISETQRRVE